MPIKADPPDLLVFTPDPGAETHAQLSHAVVVSVGTSHTHQVCDGRPLIVWDGSLKERVFSGFSIVALLIFRRPLVRYVRRSDSSRTIDSLVGETAVTLEDIAVDGLGRAELRGTTWTVRNVGTTPLRRGERSRVTHIDGLTLWVHAI